MCDSSIVATYPSIPAARFAFRLCFIRFKLSFVVVLSDEPNQNKGRGLVDHKLVHPPPLPRNFIAGRPKVALLVWFYCDFRCGVFLFMFILVKIKNR